MKIMGAIFGAILIAGNILAVPAEWNVRSKIHYEVMVCENSVNLVMREAENVLEKVRASVAQGSIAAALRKQARAQIAALEEVRELLFSVLRRGEPTYYESLCATMEANVADLGGADPKKAYEALGIDPLKGLKMSYVKIRQQIDDELKDKTTSKERKKLLRQLRALFANAFVKQEYDAYLQGQRAVELLRISAEETNRLQEIVGNVLMVKAQLDEALA